MGALPAALLAQGIPSGRWLAERRLGPPGVSPLAPLLAGAFPSTPSHDERSLGCPTWARHRPLCTDTPIRDERSQGCRAMLTPEPRL